MAKQRYAKNKQGLFETSRTFNGKRVKFRGKTCAIVDQKIRDYEEKRERGRKVPALADEWLAYREPKLRDSTYMAYDRAVKRIKDCFKTRYVKEITPLDVDRYIAHFEDQGYAKSTVEIELSVLKQMFSYAVKKTGEIDVNPAREVTHSKDLPQKKRNALTEQQEQKVEEFRGDNWLLGVMLLYTGCRRGELLALNWQDIDRKAKVIHITKKLNYTGRNEPKVDDYLKNREGRDIPLFGVLEDVLPKNRLGKIFSNEHGDYLTAYEITKLWAKYCTDVGLEGITPHCFRHSYSTICFEAGIDPKDAAAFLGDTEAVMRNVYTDLRDRHKTSSAEKVNAYIEMRRAEQKAKAQA